MGDPSGKGKWHPRWKQKDEKEGQKNPVLASVGSTANNIPYPSFRSMEDADLEEVPFPIFPAVLYGGSAPWLVSSRGFTCRIN